MKEREQGALLALFFVLFFALAAPGFGQEPPRAAAPEAASSVPGKISLDIKGMDIIDVLKMLVSKTDLNVSIDKNVSGRVTVFLKNVAPEAALEVILASSGLVAEQEGDILRVTTAQDYEARHGAKPRDLRRIQRLTLRHARPRDIAAVLAHVKSGVGQVSADEASGGLILFDTKEKNLEMARIVSSLDRPLQTAFFDLNYARGGQTLPLLQEALTPGIGSVKTDERTNKVVVTDYPEKVARVKKILAQVDERTPEVLIDAKIVQVNLSDKTSLGIDWEAVVASRWRVEGMFGDLITTSGAKWTMGTAAPQDRGDVRAVVEALEEVGETKVLSSPRLTVVNGQEARILVGSKQVYVTTSAVQSQTTTETAEAVNFVDVGVKLFVTPAIARDGFICLKVRPEVSSVVETYRTASGNVIPIVETSEAETTVILRDGSTLVLGGLMKEEAMKTTRKIPLLGDIPFLGLLFRSQKNETKKTELVIFLTCRVLTFSSDVRATRT